MDTPLDRHSGDSSSSTRAAEYVRMSTEHQQYSTENQSEAIHRYAEAHQMRIVRTYSDAGKSGLNIKGREALQQLIQDVQAGRTDFNSILVYDVSRWGRFQDADESAYYEYICKRANITVHYCAEQFINDGSLSSILAKTVKRTMAGEYSRELSVKVFAGQCRLIENGFRQGGSAGYGLRRLLQDQHGVPKVTLARGEQKSLQTDRVILVPGPPEEIAIISEIYDRFLGGTLEREIAEILCSRGCNTDLGRPWTRGTVHQVLTNPKYAGSNVYNRHSFKLKRKHVTNPPSMWIVCESAFEPVVSRDTFESARSIISARTRHYTDEEMLTLLRGLLARNGALSGIIIDESHSMPSSSAYRTRFHSLVRAYHLIGYSPGRDYAFVEVNRILRERHREAINQITADLRSLGASVSQDARTGLLLINEEFTTSLIVSRCHTTPGGGHRWHLRLEPGLAPDLTIAARFLPDNTTILDYYLFPGIDALAAQIRLAPDNPITLDVYRFPDLEFFRSVARRARIQEVA